MANPLFNNDNTNTFSQIMKGVEELKRAIPDPKAEVERLLNSGQMTQDQFNTLVQMARQILPFIK